MRAQCPHLAQQDSSRSALPAHQRASCRQVCEIGVQLAAVHGLRGNLKAQQKQLDEVISAHSTYSLPAPLVARVLKEQGAVLVELKRYDDALKAYNELLELQAERYADDTPRAAVARAECFKLVGDVYVAKRQFNRRVGQG